MLISYFCYRHDTKIMLNSFKAKMKRSTLEKFMAKQILVIFVIQVKNNILLLFI